MLKILEDLVTLARERKNNPVEGSYTNKLLENKSLAKEKVLEEINELIESVEQDTNKLLKDKNLAKEKVLEEVNELIEAVEENSNKIHEAADVLYHLIMYLEKSGIKIEEVMEELKSRKK